MYVFSTFDLISSGLNYVCYCTNNMSLVCLHVQYHVIVFLSSSPYKSRIHNLINFKKFNIVSIVCLNLWIKYSQFNNDCITLLLRHHTNNPWNKMTFVLTWKTTKRVIYINCHSLDKFIRIGIPQSTVFYEANQITNTNLTLKVGWSNVSLITHFLGTSHLFIYMAILKFLNF